MGYTLGMQQAILWADSPGKSGYASEVELLASALGLALRRVEGPDEQTSGLISLERVFRRKLKRLAGCLVNLRLADEPGGLDRLLQLLRQAKSRHPALHLVGYTEGYTTLKLAELARRGAAEGLLETSLLASARSREGKCYLRLLDRIAGPHLALVALQARLPGGVTEIVLPGRWSVTPREAHRLRRFGEVLGVSLVHTERRAGERPLELVALQVLPLLPLLCACGRLHATPAQLAARVKLWLRSAPDFRESLRAQVFHCGTSQMRFELLESGNTEQIEWLYFPLEEVQK